MLKLPNFKITNFQLQAFKIGKVTFSRKFYLFYKAGIGSL